MGQGPPLAAGPGHIQEGIDDLAARILGRSATGLGRGDEILEDVPLEVGQIGWVAQSCRHTHLYA